jgi:hypothetical protein
MSAFGRKRTLGFLGQWVPLLNVFNLRVLILPARFRYLRVRLYRRAM